MDGTTRTLQLTMNDPDIGLDRAYGQYMAARGSYPLTVTAFPEVNAPIDITPNPDAATPITRNIAYSAAVTLKAPKLTSIYRFVGWQLDGVDQPLGQTTPEPYDARPTLRTGQLPGCLDTGMHAHRTGNADPAEAAGFQHQLHQAGQRDSRPAKLPSAA